ncbi:hypothetical protein NQ318_004542 [Aromia moschata]|uniref:Uncharacterized protein n=1 Tax=Aromia moschata TaxID=1265417 RepID=A0AAV8XQA9_9CUCU|nr:hypothetical protein NQ318_004542 [Aromia moschata]
MKTTTSDSTNEGLADNNISRDIKKITKALAGIKYDITDMKNNISHIKIKLDMLENKSKSFKSTSDFKLPLTTPQQLLELENKIENATDLEDLVNILSHVGGDTVKESTFYNEKTNEQGAELTILSKRKKAKKIFFQAIEAVKVNFLDATDLEITCCIGVSLATAGDRNGGRQLRAETPNQDE